LEGEATRRVASERVGGDDRLRDVRSDRQRREDSRESRRVDRSAWRESEAEDGERRAHEHAIEEAERRAKRDEERDEWSRYWARREAARDELRLRRERLQSERHGREDEYALNKQLRESRQQLAEEAETVAASEWSHLLTVRGQERQRRLLRLARLHAALPLPPGEGSNEGAAAPSLQYEADAHAKLREAKRLRRREAALAERVHEGEHDLSELKTWYQSRAHDRVDRTRRALKQIDAPPPPVLADA